MNINITDLLLFLLIVFKFLKYEMEMEEIKQDWIYLAYKA